MARQKKHINGSKDSLTIERIKDISLLENIREDWNLLLEKNKTKTVELTYEWQITNWKYLKGNDELFVLAVREAGSLVAIAPLKLAYRKLYGIRIRLLEFIAAKDSNYQDFIVGKNSEDILECIFDYLVSIQESWDILSLSHIPETANIANYIQKRPKDSLLFKTANVDKCVYLESNISWEEYNKSRKSTRIRMNKRMKRLRKRGEISFFHCKDERQLISNLQKFFELHRKRWNKTETPSQFNDQRYCRFYEEVSIKLKSKGLVNLYVVNVGDIPVAMLYSFMFDRIYLGQLVVFNDEYEEGSPSIVIIELFVQQAFKNSSEIIDLGSYYPYKEYWARSQKKRLDFEIYQKRGIPYLIYALTTLRQALKSGARYIPFMMIIIRNLRGRKRF